jgi:hypothetical protein
MIVASLGRAYRRVASADLVRQLVDNCVGAKCEPDARRRIVDHRCPGEWRYLTPKRFVSSPAEEVPSVDSRLDHPECAKPDPKLLPS